MAAVVRESCTRGATSYYIELATSGTFADVFGAHCAAAIFISRALMSGEQ